MGKNCRRAYAIGTDMQLEEALSPRPTSQRNIRFRIVHLLYAMAVVGCFVAMMGVVGILPATAVLVAWVTMFASTHHRVVSIGLFVVFLVTLTFLVVVGSAVPVAQEAARRMSCTGHSFAMSLAIHNYSDVHDTFPPATLTNANGEAVHSWRTLVLPYLEQQATYAKYDFDEPWNSPANSTLHTAASLWRCPSTHDDVPPTHTTIVAVVGDKAALSEVGTRAFSDFDRESISNTIMLMEVNAPGVHYMQPKDLSFDEAVELLTSEEAYFDSPHDGGWYFMGGGCRSVALIDGSVRAVTGVLTREEAIAVLSTDPADKVALRGRDINEIGQRLTQLKIGNCLRLATLLLVVVLPTPWAIKRWR